MHTASPEMIAEADRATRNAALTLSLALPGDTVLYLLLPLYADSFGVTLPEAGMLLAANRLVRIVGYNHVARIYAQRGARIACMLAAGGAVCSTLSSAFLNGFWLLFVARLIWGLSFAAMNIAAQALPTSVPEGAARRSGYSRTIIAIGPMVGLLVAAALVGLVGPRMVFVVLGVFTPLTMVFAMKLPAVTEKIDLGGPRFAWPGALNIWSFCMAFTLDGLFSFGLSLLAAANFPQGAVIAAGVIMAFRYASEILFSAPGGYLAQRFGPLPVLVALSFAAAASLSLLGLSGAWLWTGIAVTVVLRALLQPLPAPVVAAAFTGAERVPALAKLATWRDVGAAAGPVAAGLLFPTVSASEIYPGAGLLLAAACLAFLVVKTHR